MNSIVNGAPPEIDWTGCELVERIPGKVSGQPIIRGTRILANTIVEDAELGSPVEELHENYPDLPIQTIQRLLVFAKTHGRTARGRSFSTTTSLTSFEPA